ncbi:nucleoprotein TPR [Cryptococcus gattii E566]|uniref:Protein-nucleus import-related protein, putative n=2 Tax=Cryptococcus gattii TaxID=37769 RepID=E6RFR0_CRYGW|nr:Protein-nucleus import-related protein, putative [Cryptococcus gattii WM276]ADV25676.1 Protein-nucleus import-related protein, putative [Cryptococcus gattii WM276]KIR78155.1 nucleoprotein TPR [Cryptococcus gattii EJB2]KIY32780.1 nucleoprotein TPR [Cryptococcus gattii E566]KJD99653.1 nucleoprotein TPR [Cryptococcus gattii NT-10]
MSEGGPHVDNHAQPEQSAQLPQQLDPQPAAAQEGETLPSRAPQTDIAQAVPLPDDIRLQIEQEQALADAQKRVRELEEQVGKLSTEKEGVVGERDGAVAASNQLRTQLSNLQSSHHKTTSELSVLQTRLDSIEREKKELYEEAERLHQRSNKNIQELYALRSAKTDAAQKIAHLDVEVSELRMITETAKFNEKRSIQALESARAEIISLSKAVSEVEERFGRYRAEAQSDQSKFRAENESLITRLSTLEQSHRSLQRAYNDQSSRLAEAHASIATLTSTAAANKAAVAVDVLAMEEANRLLERRLDEARSTVLEREAELENMASAHEEREKNWEAKMKKEERMRKEVEKKMGDLKKIADRLDMVEGRGGYVSASAAVAGEMRMNGKSYTQLYTDFTIQESRLQAAEGEVERLTNLLDEISQELNEKKPILDEQAAEHARAIERANALASELASVISARDTLQNEVKSLQAASTHHTSEVSSLQSSVDDLSRQVKTLLRQISIKDDPSLASVAVDGDAEVSPTGDIITDHLIEFRSIRSLQEQNQRLLKITRSLMKKLDEREIARAEGEEEDEVTGRTLDEATEMIKKLHKDVLDAQKRVGDVTRERDLFSKLLARGEGLRWSVSASSGHPGVHGAQRGHGPLDEDADTPSNQQLATLQAELDVFKEKAHGDLEEARKEIRKKMEEAAKADVERARAEAKVGLLEDVLMTRLFLNCRIIEQAKALTEASQQQKTDFAGLETQLRQLQAAVAQAHNEQRAALEQVAARQVESDRLRNEAAMLRAEKDQWKSLEARLQSDFAQVQSERVKLQQLIDNLRNVANEAEKSRIEEREGLEKRIEEVQREATTLREQIEQTRAATREAEKKSQDFESRLEAATTSLRAEKEVASALATTRAEELAKVQADYEKAKTDSESRLRIGLNWKRRVDTLNEQIGNTAKAHLEAISEKEKKVEEAEKKVKAAEEEVQTLKKKVEETEGTVQRLQTELANTQKLEGQAQGQVQADSTALSELQNEKNQLAEKLAQAEKELETLKATAAQEDKERDERYENNVARVNRVNAQMKARIDTLVQEKQTTQASVESLQAKISELEAKLTELESAATNTNAIAAASSDAAVGPANEAAVVTRETKPSQEQINEAVNAAVAAREAELQSKFAKDLEEATTAAATAAAAAASSFAPQLTTAPAAPAAPVIDTEATAKKAAELEATFENRVAEAVQTEKTALEEEIKQLKGQVEELKNKIKALERQVKTAEISRKTLERQKTEVEKKLGEATSAAAATAESAGSAGVTEEVKQVEESAQGAAAAKVTPTRGRGRGTATRGRGGATGRPNPVLSAVNATLAASTLPAAAEASGTKRPLPEDGEIPTSENTQAAAAGSASPAAGSGERGGRLLKRPRGAAATRGGRGGRGGAGSGAGGAGSAGSAGGADETN